ncbi:GTP pyrophosphokinase [Paenibacillus selenitireducens]|uniref:GTP pyrophosphokinase n=2 Tax=Paenibacillus selenitireducens TaxID=1324314 RepID=A0A1T2XD73_9BACL|nr:GTP pyrophosphokinase [Paenibacillus selenitireducens]
MLVYRFALEEVNTKLKILNEEMSFIQHYNPIEHLKTRLKKPKSILTKLERKGLDITVDNVREHVRDIAGVRVTCSFNADVYKVYELICQQNDVEVLEMKDYIKHPKENGYQSLHLIISIPVFMTNQTQHVPVEIQIRTIAMDFWASLEHKIYYKFKKNVPDEIRLELKETADTIAMLDGRMMRLNEKVQMIKDQSSEEDDLFERVNQYL